MAVKRLSMLLVGVCLVSVRGHDEVFAAVPGNLTVLQGSPLSLIWSVNRASDDIGWCDWSYRDANSSSVTPFTKFLGLSNMNNGRNNFSNRHSGWQFINDNDGCRGGLKKKVSGSYDTGQYQIEIEMQGHVIGKRVFTNIASVNVVAGKDVRYNIQIQNSTYNLTLSEPTTQVLPKRVIHTDEYISVCADLLDKFPQSDIKISQDGRTVSDCPLAAQCCREISYQTPTTEGVIKIWIETAIRGAHVVVIEQPVTASGDPTIVQKSATTSGAHSLSPWAAAGISIAITIVILVTIIVLCVLVWWEKGWMKRSKENPELFTIKAPRCMTRSHHSLQEQTPLNIEESQMIALVDVKTQFEPLYEKLQEDVEKLLKRENDTSSKYQRQIDSFGDLSNKLEDEEIPLNKVLSNLSVTHMNADKLLSEHIEFITRIDEEIKKIRLDPVMKNSMARDKREAVSSKEEVELLMNQCDTNSTFILETLRPELQQIDTDIELYKNKTQCQQNTLSDICDNCRRTDPAVVSSRHDVLQSDSEDQRQLSEQNLEMQISDYSNLYEASIRLREMLDELQYTPNDKHDQHDQVKNRIEEAQRKCSAQDMKLKNSNDKLMALNNDFYKMCNDSHVG